jgi:DNA-directed RNA polymerase specialized sigma24 family protein
MQQRENKEIQVIEEKFLKLVDLGISPEETFRIIQARLKEREQAKVPISIFSTEELAALEAIVKYLKEEKQMSYGHIARILGRNRIPIGVTYRSARRKLADPLPKSGEQVPLSIFSQQLSILESLVWYFKHKGWKYSEIARALHRDQRTIWTVYRRAMRKMNI